MYLIKVSKVLATCHWLTWYHKIGLGRGASWNVGQLQEWLQLIPQDNQCYMGFQNWPYIFPWCWAVIRGSWWGWSEKAMAPHSSTLAWKIPWTEEPGRLQSTGSQESDTTERLHFLFSLLCTGEGNGTHSSVLAWRIPGTGKPGGLPSMGSHRVGHDWSDLAAAGEGGRTLGHPVQFLKISSWWGTCGWVPWS